MTQTNRLISLFAAILFSATMMADVVYEPLIVDSGFNRDVIKAIGSDTAISALYKTGSTSCFGTKSFIAQCNSAWETSDYDNYVRTVRSGWPDDPTNDPDNRIIRCTDDGDAKNDPKYKDVWWRLAPYNAPNALCLRPIETSGTIKGFQNEGTLKFKKIGSYQKLYFLVVSLREGKVADREITTTIYYTDGTSSSTKFTMIQGLKGEAGQRVCMTNVYETTFNKNKIGESTTAFAEVFEVSLNHTKLVSKIHFSNSVLNSSATILAVTGRTADVEIPDEETMAVSNIDKTSFQACWDAIEDAASYRIDVAEDIDFQRILEDYNNLPVSGSTCQDIVDLVSNTDYYWRVRSVNEDGGQSASSAVRRVTTAPDKENGDTPPYTDEEYTNIEENLAQYIGTKATLAELDIHRTLYRDGAFNTLCLPFDLNAEQIAASPLAGAQVYEFVHAAKNQSGQLDIEINGPIDAITAGVPYLVKWNPTTPEVIDGGILVFKNVNVSTNHGQTLGEEGEVQFVGNIGIATLVEEEQLGYDHNKLFLGAANTLYWPEENTHLKGFRAYFIVPDNDNGAPKRTPARLVMHQDVTTDVIRIQPSAVSVQKALQNGQIVILREGKRYSILGTQL